MNGEAVFALEDDLLWCDEGRSREICRQSLLRDHGAAFVGDLAGHGGRDGGGAEAENRLAISGLNRRPLDGFTGSKCLRCAASDGNAPQVAAIDVVLIRR